MFVKKCISLLLILMLMLSLFACSAQTAEPAVSPTATAEPEATEAPAPSAPPEIAEAKTLGIEPETWESDLNASADFAAFYDMATKLITTVDETALAGWTEKVNRDKFPSRSMRRDDALMLIMEAANALGWITYNARDYGFCTENEVDYDQMFSQLSWDYPY